jgi:site-specific recombinase XerD
MVIKQAVEDFMAGYFSMRDRSCKTKIAYATDLSQLRSYLGDAHCIQQLSVDILEQWAAILSNDGYAPVSIRRKFATVRVFLGYWVRRGLLSGSPLWQVRLDFGREQRLPRCLSATDMTRLIEHAWTIFCDHQAHANDAAALSVRSRRNLTILEILFATGIRVGELVSLNLEDWNDSEQSFIVRGKGMRQRLAVLTDERSIKVVRGYVRVRRELCLDHDSFFANRAGSRLAAQGVARIIDKFARDTGLSVRVTPHMIRHTVATLLLRHGADIRVIQEVLGHTSIATTQRYTHVSKEHLRLTLGTYHPNHHLHIIGSLKDQAEQQVPSKFAPTRSPAFIDARSFIRKTG